MNEIITIIDNWTIIKFLGGLALVITAVIGFFSKYILSKLKQSSQFNYDKRIENIKGDIDKNNATLNTAIQNHFSSTQKILDKKIQAYDTLWLCILELRNKFSPSISMIYTIFPESWFTKQNSFAELDANPKIGPLLRNLSGNEIDINKLLEIGTPLIQFKPYLSDKAYKLFYTYRALYWKDNFNVSY